ncbi:hypothetical protein EHI8A_071550 [Entamoeba histolytica HM-1:IMSS-B]|uniref:Uncharacterized protein n=6 Tax=Entamoeba histolytica TaxID=5759 RepID=C4M3M5_ENTH1|nr:hypothetical protein EHI_140520 [Entamoeba histolytica HM-1:IMSS]EMD44812.1 Hypothetical protein EHI5A_085180 [Entamoeba histolytica KU27]EMH75198.1 hypothetical protein EHI8A_071550 [Entamoeba histolytica HM-1:IMSS-B]EMS16373.1 hypothetical protein KM1_107140 [Entamoeba histolytica HM-3:IMSS]ENY62072.1 hypothetical protein EHI7A_056060 [Entamoeba histolytica HM-1:IMSS-A]GAT95926.1 hypothetical protein CL6EHI_140520 [Entamoeba histolytica]|eukprot:XP_654192.1 hypothetical protein EHI_140520 [Entamoeba histolytica HM-1:IMSS]
MEEGKVYDVEVKPMVNDEIIVFESSAVGGAETLDQPDIDQIQIEGQTYQMVNKPNQKIQFVLQYSDEGIQLHEVKLKRLDKKGISQSDNNQSMKMEDEESDVDDYFGENEEEDDESNEDDDSNGDALAAFDKADDNENDDLKDSDSEGDD